jgi:hypothetical protein
MILISSLVHRLSYHSTLHILDIKVAFKNPQKETVNKNEGLEYRQKHSKFRTGVSDVIRKEAVTNSKCSETKRKYQ